MFMQICVFLDTGKGKQLEQSFAYLCMLGAQRALLQLWISYK